MSPLQITLCHDALAASHLTDLQEACADWATVIPAPEKNAAGRSTILGSDIVIGWPNVEALVGSRTRFFQCGSTGYEDYTNRGLENKPSFTMSNSAGTMSIPVAEHGVALMMAGNRRLDRHAQDQLSQRFERYAPYREVFGATACICGLGSIGTELARMCFGLGMRVTGVRQNASKPHPFVTEIYPLDQLKRAVSDADHVFIVLPLTHETRGTFNREVFSNMKRGASLYALARGSHYVEADLIEALYSGQLGFAGLDVFTQEPLPPESALWEAPNTLITPHCSGRSEHEHRRMRDLVIDNLQRFRCRQPLRNVVMQNS